MINKCLKLKSSFIFAITMFAATSANALYVCQEDYDPQGNPNHENMVITKKMGASSYENCDGDLKYEIKEAYNGIVACTNSVMPEGFISYEFGTNYYGCGKPHLSGNPDHGSGKKIKRPSTSIHSDQNMCSDGTEVPEGFAIRQVTTNSICKPSSSYSGVMYKIIYPNGTRGVRTDVCAWGDVPNGFAIYDTYANYGCEFNGGGGSGPGRKIGVPSANEAAVLCAGSNIPDGMVYIESGTYSGCGHNGSSGSGFKVGPVVASGSSVCASSPLPSGYVITRDETNTRCSNNKGHYIKRSDYLSSSGSWICADHSNEVPSGFFITGKAYAAHGCDGVEYNIRKPASGAVVCDGSQLPDGWAGYQCGSSYSQCKYNSNGSSYGCKIRPLQSGDSVCEGKTTIPNGWVITKRESSSLCTGSLITIQDPSDSPGTETTACHGSTIPDGFVITRDKGVSYCGTFGGSRITRPTTSGSTAMCAGGDVPAGFGIVSTNSSTTYCNGGYWNISRITSTGTYHLCYGQDIPQGYVATEISSLCPNNLGYVITTPHSPMDVCRVSLTPEDYVISKKYTSTNGPCGLEKSMRIQYPNQFGQTGICPDKNGEMPIPDGYTFDSSDSSHCDGSGGGYITPESFEPAPYIDVEPDTTTSSVQSPSVGCSAGSPNAGAFVNGASSNNGC